MSGGIGSGKSIVCKILRSMGYPCYDCDSHARSIMEGDMEIKRSIAAALGEDTLKADGTLDRNRISQIVFGDRNYLYKLNSIVHGAVRDDLHRWCLELCHDHKILFVETAILYESGLDRMVEAVWQVTAPAELRVQRVMSRNGLSADAVKARIKAQEAAVPAVHPPTYPIVNDGKTGLLPQVLSLLAEASQVQPRG